MSSNVESLESLVRLSKEATSEGRSELLHEITNLFLDNNDTHSDQEVAYFGEIMGALASQTDARNRQQLAESVAEISTTPRGLVKTLASDEIDVAGPILSKSTVLSSDDLVQVIKQHSQEHLLAISTRRVVPEMVADALVERGNDDVLDTLADNEGAVLSDQTIETMVSKSANPGNIAKALASRGDMAPEMVEKMISHVSQSVHKYVEENRAELTDNQISTMLDDARAWAVNKTIDEQEETAFSFIKRKEQLGLLDGKLLVRLLRTSEVEKFIAGISHMASIDQSIARKTVFDKVGDKLAVICKSQDMTDDIFMDLYDLTNFDKSRTPEDRKMIEGVYGRMTSESAQRALRFLRTRAGVKKKLETDIPVDTRKSWS